MSASQDPYDNVIDVRPLGPALAATFPSTLARPGVVAGWIFAPEQPLWATLVGVKRGESHLFLRYAFRAAG